MVIICLRRQLPAVSSSLPEGCSLTERERDAPQPVGLPLCLTLLPAGVTWPRRLPVAPVVSYTTFSPLPAPKGGGLFLWPCPRVAPSGRYPALFPMESGLSSTCDTTRRDHLANSGSIACYHRMGIGQWRLMNLGGMERGFSVLHTPAPGLEALVT